MRKTNFLVLILFIFLVHKQSLAQIHDFDSLVQNNVEFAVVAKNVSDTFDLFNETKLLEVTFISDFKNLVKRKYKDEYQDAVFKIMFNDSVEVTREIKIKPRGIMRKNICFIPPIKLNFPKKEAFIKQLMYFDKLKMVLDCKGGEMYEQYLLTEYYAYKIQNLITDYSLRVRLLKVKYIDTGGRFKDETKYAFIIESIDQLAERLNAIRVEVENVRDIRTETRVLVDSYFFQYLIGNTDWSIPAMHNMYLIKSKDPAIYKPYVVPYDFDYAGIVNANYAVPDENLGTESVRERVYRGICLDETELNPSRQLVLEKKKAIYDLFEKDKYLNKSKLKFTLRYIDEFYKIMENDNLYKRFIVNGCRD